MVQLPAAVLAWNTPTFAATLKQELEAIGGAPLPLQQALAVSNAVFDDRIEVIFIAATEEHGRIRAKVGIFFAGIVAGCACADDPTPIPTQTEYGEFALTLDMTTAVADIKLWTDQVLHQEEREEQK